MQYNAKNILYLSTHNFNIPFLRLQQKYVSMKNILKTTLITTILMLYFRQIASAEPSDINNSWGYDAEVTPTIKKKTLELDKYKIGANQMDLKNQPTSMFSFEQTKMSLDFHLHLSYDTNLTFLIQVYILKEREYSHIQNIAKQPPIRVYIYQNNRILVNQVFYFYGIITIPGKKDNNYMLRFYSTATNKAVMVEHTKVLDSSIFIDKLKKSSTQQQVAKLSAIKSKFTRIENQLKRNHRMFESNQKSLLAKIDSFTTFEILEILIAFVVCFIEIKLIKSLFKSQQII